MFHVSFVEQLIYLEAPTEFGLTKTLPLYDTSNLALAGTDIQS
jgi:hypothetical protein